MQEDELKAILQAEVKQAIGVSDSALSKDRTDGWDAYLRQPDGKEVEGRSTVVSSDVQDTVEWIMPSLMRIFTASESAVEFDPTGPEDEEGAEQATDYCNYVWDKDNPGFLNFHTWFKESLVAKLGTVKAYWEVKDKWKKERYQGLDDNAYAMVLASPDAEIVAHTERQELQPAPIDQPGEPQMVTLHDVIIKMKETAGKTCIDPVPAEEILFSSDAKDVQNCRFFAHRTKRTISDLVEEYPDKRTMIEELSSDGSSSLNTESTARSTVNEDDDGEIGAAINKAMRQVEVTEAYLRVDYDGDGIAEMRKVTSVGKGAELLDNEEWDGPRPFATLCPILIPHRLVGLGIPDLIDDIQKIKTAILRQFLDAIYIANNPRQEVDMERIFDPGELLTSKTGGFVRVTGAPGVQAIRPIQVTPVAEQALAGLGYVDQMRENRTGVSPRTQGLGADTLHDTKGGQDLLFDAARMRTELIARIFAETGVKDVFKLILWNAHKYQDKKRTIRLRNKWVDVDPREWADEYDISARVGLGHNDDQKQMMALGTIAGLQTAAVQFQQGANGPLVTLDNLHNTAVRMVKASGEKAPELFFSDPKDPNTPKPQPKPDPEMMKIQAEGQQKQQEAQQKSQLEAQKAQQDYQLKTAEMQQKAQIEQIQAEADIAVKREEMQMKREESALKMQLEVAKHQMSMQSEATRLNAEKERGQAELGMMKNKHKLDARLAVRNSRLKSRRSSEPKNG